MLFRSRNARALYRWSPGCGCAERPNPRELRPQPQSPIASTSTASYSPKIKVDVIGSKPSASQKGFGRSPTIAFPGAVKTFTLSVPDPGKINSFMNIRVADIQACYELWKSRGAEFITKPIPKYGEIRCYIRDPDGYIIEVGQSTDQTYG